jgi:3'-phosphoadenosine 5'-phosphosulfate sulfotransferase (PAPS reductase)/FAD synthetase
MNVKILVPVSGGKDSQATLKLATYMYGTEGILGLFCDTKYEHPETYRHVDRIEKMYGVPIVRVSDGSVEQQCYKHKRLPSGTARFCTEELKIWPTKRFCHDLAIKQGSRLQNKRAKATASTNGGFEVWYGMRSGESPDRGKRYMGKVCDELYEPHDVLAKYPKRLGKLGVRFRLPVLDWTEQEIKEFVGADELHPFYALGFDRVGCFPCEASGDGPRIKAYSHDDFGRAQHRKIIKIAADLGRPVFNSKGGDAKFAAACALHCGT